MPLHRDLTGSDLHEPKGADTASANTAYFADGSGSGSWRKITASDIDSSVQNPNTVYMNAVIPDVSTASFVLVPVLDGMSIESAKLTLGGAIATSNASVLFTRNDGASLGSAVTITHSGSAEGTTFTFTASTNQAISSSGYVKITTDGGSDNSVPLYITLKFIRTP